MHKISCFIVSYKDGRSIASQLETAIKSVIDICDEVIIIDSSKTDHTNKIAESLGARVVSKQWEGYLKQKIYGESLCKYDWILYINPEEEFTKDLQTEIKVISTTNLIEKYKAYRINSMILSLEDKKPRFLGPYIQSIRLYNKNYGSFAASGPSSGPWSGSSSDGSSNGSSNRSSNRSSNGSSGTSSDTAKFYDIVSMNQDCASKDIFSLMYPAYDRSTSYRDQVANKYHFDLTRSGGDAHISFFMRPLFFLKIFCIDRYCTLGLHGLVFAMTLAFSKLTIWSE